MSKFLCPRCPKQFQSENDLKRHLIKMHGVERRMKGKPEANQSKPTEPKTLCEMNRFCESCDKDCRIEELEGENKKLQTEIILWQNKYAVNTARGIALEKRLETIRPHVEQMPKENQSIYWTSICDDEIQDEFIGQKFFPDLHKWYERLGVLLEEGVKKVE